MELDQELDNLMRASRLLYDLRTSLDSANTVGWSILYRATKRVDAQVQERVTV